MANKVYIAASLDGYIADKHGGIDWLHQIPNPQGSDLGFAEFIAGVDALLMGRNTFEVVVGFGGDWPYPKPVFVLSHSLPSIPAGYQDKATLLSGDVSDICQQLHGAGYRNLYIDGGVVIQQCLRAGLIDELTITRIPVVLGGGAPLFADLATPQSFSHVHTEVLLGQLVKSHYRKV